MRFSLKQRLKLKKRPPGDSSSSLPFSALSSKTPLALLPLLLLPYSFNTQALSAITANTIQGTAPYIELNGIKATDLSRLLSIKIGEKTYISNAYGNMSEVGVGGALTWEAPPISLANAGDTFASVSTLVPSDGTSYALNNTTFIPLTSRKDADGDDTFTIAGNVQGFWKDKDGKAIAVDSTGKSDLTAVPNDMCKAPYTLTLTTTNAPFISTQYGDPNITTYGNSSVVFKIKPALNPVVCYAKPDMTYAKLDYAGPVSMWNTTNGFIPQSTSSATYGSNFPTTGANGLYFDLAIGGASTALTWNTVTNGVITATPSNSSIGSVRYTLTGPASTATQQNSATPTSVVVPTLPATFELAGTDGSGTVVIKYGFTLQKWFINRGSIVSHPVQLWFPDNSHSGWCNNVGYRIIKVADVSNAAITATVNSVTYSAPSAAPLSTGNFYQRRINGGFFSEWGMLQNFYGSGFVSNLYWTGDVMGSTGYYWRVNAATGYIGYTNNYQSAYGMCVRP